MSGVNDYLRLVNKDRWPCGHPKTPFNTRFRLEGGQRCLTCHRSENAAWHVKQREKRA